MSSFAKRETYEIKLLLQSVPAPVLTLFAVSVIVMNLLANKSVDLPVSWLALDCGIIVSWVSFLSMDVITKHFGPKAATQLSVAAAVFNLLTCLIFFAASRISGTWGESYSAATFDGANTVNAALDATFGGTWYVLLGSTVAFLTSAAVNNFINFAIGSLAKKNPDSFAAYALRTYFSTAVGQFTDNMVFALIVGRVFFGWSMLQCVTCSAVGMAAELICEVIFSPIGYAVCRKWKKENVGSAYLEYRATLISGKGNAKA